MQAFSVISRVLRDFDARLSPGDMFACNSVGAMAALIAERQRATDGDADVGIGEG